MVHGSSFMVHRSYYVTDDEQGTRNKEGGTIFQEGIKNKRGQAA
jgi:hypothetical protein